MNTNTLFAQPVSYRKTLLILAIVAPAALVALPLLSADRGGPRPGPARTVVVDRTSHGSVRHVDTHVVQRPVEVHPAPEHPVDVHREVAPRHDVVVHRDVEADVRRPHFWDNFAFGRHLAALPVGFINLRIGGVPYCYDDGIYYQPVSGGYQEVYPPVGAEIAGPPDGAFEVEAGGMTYYYAGGAFYAEQPDGSYTVVPAPMGVVVPELPPGAVQVSANGVAAYQFNGIYYEPVFVNGVTQYQTFMP